jgi:hypothetical protein
LMCCLCACSCVAFVRSTCACVCECVVLAVMFGLSDCLFRPCLTICDREASSSFWHRPAGGRFSIGAAMLSLDSPCRGRRLCGLIPAILLSADRCKQEKFVANSAEQTVLPGVEHDYCVSAIEVATRVFSVFSVSLTPHSSHNVSSVTNFSRRTGVSHWS